MRDHPCDDFAEENEPLLDLAEADDFTPDAAARAVAALLEFVPNFPEQVARDWLLKHGRNAFRVFGWIPYESLVFERAERSVDFFLSEVNTSNPPAIESWSRAVHGHLAETRLAKFMREHGTWPVPPVVLEHSEVLVDPDGYEIVSPHLLEGHHRLAYLRGLSSLERGVLDRHQVWLARIEARTLS